MNIIRFSEEDAKMAELLGMTPVQYASYKMPIARERPTIEMLEDYLSRHRKGRKINDRDMAEDIMVALRAIGWTL